MKLRHILIITTTILIMIAFGSASYLSYYIGVDYGEQNAETIRAERIQDSMSKKTKDSISNIDTDKSVEVIKVKNNFNQQIIESSGRVSSSQNITISSEVQGKLKRGSSLKKGRIFNKNDVLFSIENDDFSLLLKARKSNLLNLISSNLTDIQFEFEKDQSIYEKWETFFQNIDIKSDLPDFPEYNTAKEKNFIISRSILSEYLSIKSDEERLRKYTTYAPFNGSITRSYTDIGATVNPGSPIIDIIRNELLEVELPISKSEADKINIGDEINLILIDEDSDTISAKIVRKGNSVDKRTQNISLFATLPASKKILSGMYVNARIPANENVKTVTIPRRSIFGKNNIYIVDQNNTLRKKEITIYSNEKNTVNIIGLTDNTLVVSEPIIDAKEGMKVDPFKK